MLEEGKDNGTLALEKDNTETIIELLENLKIIGRKWMYTIRHKPNGVV